MIFRPVFKVAWNIRTPPITYQNWYKTIQHDGDLRSTRKNNFNVEKTVANNKKIPNIAFLAQT